MRLPVLGICLLLIATSAHGYAYWNDIRHSALLPGGEISVKIENPTGAGVENYILHATGQVVEEAMVPILDGPSTVSAAVPGPSSGDKYYGFRLIHGEDLDLMPVRLENGADPVPQDLTRLAEDPAGDHLFGYVNLDLVDCHLSFSGDRLYAALKNAGGGFPVISGLTFFGYLLGIADPAQSDPDTVFGLMQTFNQPGIISPGLYKITGTGLGNLTKIGEVVVEEFLPLNTLMISCELADLFADPYFVSWYNPADPTIGVAAFTQRITLLGGAQESDRSPGGRCYLREFAVASETNILPELSEFAFKGTGSGAVAEIDYYDANGNCPVLAEIVFDDTLAFPMYPLTLDYASPVTYGTAPGIAPLADDSWTDAVLRFSDDGLNVVEYEPPRNAVPGGGARGSGTAHAIRIAPNPFRTAAAIEFAMQASGRVRVEIYGTDGRLIRVLIDNVVGDGPVRLAWDGLDAMGTPVASGVYYIHMSTPISKETKKMAVLR